MVVGEFQIAATLMHNKPLDYSKYSREDLESALSGIDREKYPETYQALISALQTVRDRLEVRAKDEAIRLERERGRPIHGSDFPMPSSFWVEKLSNGTRILHRSRSWFTFIASLGFLLVFFFFMHHITGATESWKWLAALMAGVVFLNFILAGRFSFTLQENRLIARKRIFRWVRTETF